MGVQEGHSFHVCMSDIGYGEIFSKIQVLLATFEHYFDVPVLSILTDDLIFIHFGIGTQQADPLLGIFRSHGLGSATHLFDLTRSAEIDIFMCF